MESCSGSRDGLILPIKIGLSGMFGSYQFLYSGYDGFVKAILARLMLLLTTQVLARFFLKDPILTSYLAVHILTFEPLLRVIMNFLVQLLSHIHMRLLQIRTFIITTHIYGSLVIVEIMV